MSTITKDLGAVTAYAYAKEKGYTGTEAEYAELMASYATVAQQAGESAQTATEKASEASQSATDAQIAKTASETAKGIAESARDEAESARDDAQQSATTASQKAQEASQSAQTASKKASEASQSATDAQTAKTASEAAQGIAESARDDAESARDTASQSVQTASEKAQQASASATSASQSADTASASAQTAQTAQQTATAKASEAQQSATTATTKAQEASQSASESSQSAQTAVQAKQDAQTAKNASETAQASAESARDDAETARDEAQQYAESIDPQKLIGAYPVDTATGAIANFPDGADNIPMKSVKVRIEPVQDLSHGDPSPDNICPISGWEEVKVSHSGADTSDPSTITIPLPQTVYGGTLDVTTGELVVDRAMADLGTLSWALDGSRLKARIDNMANKAGRTIKMACSCFKALANGEPYDASADLVCYGAYSYVYVHDFAYTDIAAFKTAVTGQQLAYELAEPITLTLSPTEIKSLLADNNIWADTGDTTAIYRADTTLYINRKIAEAISALS